MARKQHYMTEQERYQLEAWRRAGKSVAWIAQELGCNRQTVYNELSRGDVGGAYSAARGQAVQDARSHNKGCPQKIGQDAPLLAFLERKMLGVQEDGTTDARQRFSPAAALAAAEAEGFAVNISLSTLYNYIDQEVFPTLRNSDLWEKTKRKPRKKQKTPRVAHENLPSIAERPREIDERNEPGHWEMDLIVGPQGSKPCLLTLTDRTTREEIIIRLPNKKAQTVRRAFNRLERNTPNFREKFKTITTDNGSEFLEYEKLKKSVVDKGDRFQIYYCHSYSAWEKGTNENQNKMARRWFPKGTDFSTVTKEDVKACQDWMNEYPRKILGWKTPLQAARGPARLKPWRGAPLSFPLSANFKPAFGWIFYAIHIYLLRVLLQFQYLIFGHHVPGFHLVFQIAHTGQCVVGLIILIFHKPAGAGEGSHHLGRGGVFEVPGIVGAQPLESPQLVTVHNIACDLPEKRVHMAEPLRGIKQADVIMSARQNRIQKQRVDVRLEIPTVHLDRELIAKYKCNRQSIVFIIIRLFPFSRQNNLFQRYKFLIRYFQRDIADNLYFLCHDLPPPRAPDGFSVIGFVGRYHTMYGGQRFPTTKQAGIAHQFTGSAEVVILMQNVMVNIPESIHCQTDGMGNRTPKCREEYQQKTDNQKNHNCHNATLKTPVIHKHRADFPHSGEYAADKSHGEHKVKQVWNQLRQSFRRYGIHSDQAKEFR